MKIQSSWLVVFAWLLLQSCAQKKEEGFTISGKIDGFSNKAIYLEELGFKGSLIVDTAHTGEDGAFSLTSTYKEPGLYRLRIDEETLFLVVDNKNIEIHASAEQLPKYTSKGSAGTTSLIRFQSDYFQLNQELLALRMAYDSLERQAKGDSILFVVANEIDGKAQQLLDYIKHFSDTTKSLPVAVFSASKLFAFDQETGYLQDFASKLPSRFSPTKLSKDFMAVVMERAQTASRNASQGPQVGTMAPDFELASIEDGKTIRLSDFKGRYVLIDFWASWCPPCRAENPNVVAVFERYQDANFTVLGVSLDSKRDKWIEAVEEDKLTWSHVSDLKGWDSEVADIYGVQSIPSNYLIDPSGKIVATNLRGDNLERAVQQALKSGNTQSKPQQDVNP